MSVELDMLIGGESVGEGLRIEVFNPAHPDQRVGSIAQGGPDHARQAIAAAKAAQPAWAARSFTQAGGGPGAYARRRR